MYSPTRRTALAVLLVAALVAVLGVCAQDITLDTTGSVSGMSFNDATATIYLFEKTGSEDASGLNIDYVDSTVAGTSGLTVKGLASATSKVAIPVTTTFTSTLVTDSSITVSGTLPPHYALIFAGVEALQQSEGKALFTLESLAMTMNGTLTIRAVSAKWESGSSNVVVGVSGAAPTIETNSGLFITSTKAEGSVASVVSCEQSFTVSDNSVFAVDVVQCATCTGPVVSQAGILMVLDNSIYRVSGVTAGSSTLISANGDVSVSGGSIFQVSDSSVSGSYFFDFGGAFDLDDAESKAVFTGLTGANADRIVSGTGSIPTSLCSTCNMYGGSSSTTSSGQLDTIDKWESSGVAITVVVDEGGAVASGTPNGDTAPATGCSAATCLMANTQSPGTVGSCACQCEPGFNAPSCTSSADTGDVAAAECTQPNCLACDANGQCAQCAYGYTVENGQCSVTGGATCAAPHCITCKAGTTDKCAQCEAGFLPDGSDTCVPIPVCTAPNCAECEYLDGSKCKVCAANSIMTSGGTCQLCSTFMTGCEACSSTSYCTKCASSYDLESGKCVNKFNGASAYPVVLALVTPIVSALAAYAL